MNRIRGSYLLVAALATLAVVAAACGSTNTPGTTSKGTITVAGFNFPESSILANLYGEALAHDGYTVNYKLNLGTRKVIAPALSSGQIDMYPGYAASELEYYNNAAGEATADPVATTAKLNTYLAKINAVALTPSAAFDGNAYAVTKATATKYNLTKLSDLTPIAGQLVFGAGPECPTYKFCLPGLMSVYGLHFKQTLTLDTDGPATVAPALSSGQIDLYPGYAASELEYYNHAAGEATSDPVATTAKLNTYLATINAVALTPSAAFDGNAYAVTKATATKYNLTKLSDLTPIAGQLVFGAGPECPTYKFCLPGLMSVYGLHFKQTLTLDTDGPATRAAFKNGSIQVGLVFSSDADLNALGLVVLQDDMHMIAADNVVPVVRTAIATDEVKTVLNKIDAGLTTADLVTMNGQVELLHQDADAVAMAYLQQHNYFS